MYRIGVDVGGTFTDFTVFGGPDGKVSFFKVPSTPHDPSEAIQAGLKQIIEAMELDPKDISQLGHGTTVATNMIIERRGVTTGLLTTKGFRDALEVGRQVRPSLYDYSVRKPEPLVERVEPPRGRRAARFPRRGGRPAKPRPARRRGRNLAPQPREVGSHLLHALLPKPCPRGGGQGRGAAAHARRVRERVLGGVARVPRIRAHVDDGAQRVCRPADADLPGSVFGARARPRHRRRTLHDPLQRRPSLGPYRGAIPGTAPACQDRRRVWSARP